MSRIHRVVFRRAPKRAYGLMFTLGAVLSFAAAYSHAQDTQALDNALATANSWLAQADADQAELMWQNSDGVLQKSIGKNAWKKYLTGLHRQWGALKGREWLQVAHISDPSGLPPGEYLNVIYSATYANAPMLETVSLMRSGNNWTPVGYTVRPVHVQASPIAQATAAH
jgi:Protein of unknown function (DUF4019)